MSQPAPSKGDYLSFNMVAAHVYHAVGDAIRNVYQSTDWSTSVSNRQALYKERKEILSDIAQSTFLELHHNLSQDQLNIIIQTIHRRFALTPNKEETNYRTEVDPAHSVLFEEPPLPTNKPPTKSSTRLLKNKEPVSQPTTQLMRKPTRTPYAISTSSGIDWSKYPTRPTAQEITLISSTNISKSMADQLAKPNPPHHIVVNPHPLQLPSNESAS